MTEYVADEILGKIARQQHDLFRRVREGTLDPQQVSQGIQVLIEGRFQNGTALTVPAFARDMTKEGWILAEDVGGVPVDFAIAELETASFLNKGENVISGDTMCKRAKDMNANLGQCHAEYFLDHQDEIPMEWRKYSLVFPGTVWRDRGGHLRVPYLRWDGKRWSLYFYWLDHGWDSHGRLLRPRK